MTDTLKNLPKIPKPATDSMEKLITPDLCEIVRKLYQWFGNTTETSAWLHEVNPHFSNRSPMELILLGKVEVVSDFIDRAIDESRPEGETELEALRRENAELKTSLNNIYAAQNG